MDTQIISAFDRAKERLAQLTALEGEIKQVSAELDSLAVTEREMNGNLLKENADVEKMETNNITTVFYSLTGSLDEHVEKERSEAFAAQQTYKQVLKDMESVKSRIAALSAGLAAFAGCRSEYERLYNLKRDEIIRENGETSRQITALMQSAGNAKTMQNDIMEASAAAAQMFDFINAALKKLNKICFTSRLSKTVAAETYTREALDTLEDSHLLLHDLKLKLERLHINTDFITVSDGAAVFAFESRFHPEPVSFWQVSDSVAEAERFQISVLGVKTRLWDICEALKKMSASVGAELASFETQINTLVIEA